MSVIRNSASDVRIFNLRERTAQLFALRLLSSSLLPSSPSLSSRFSVPRKRETCVRRSKLFPLLETFRGAFLARTEFTVRAGKITIDTLIAIERAPPSGGKG